MYDVIFIKNPCDANSAEKHLDDDVREFYLNLLNEYPTARIYHNDYARDTDVTEMCLHQELKFYELGGRFIIVNEPKGIELVVAGIISLVVGVAVALLMPTPAIPSTTGATGSTNNSFSDRTNKPNIDGAIDDIYGTVEAIPKLLTAPYLYYKDGIEIEELVMTPGLGFYQIPSETFKDGDTPFSEITGSQYEQFDPSIAVDSGVIFTEAPFAGKKSNSINGQTLLNPNLEKSNTDGFYFVYPNKIVSLPNNIERINILRFGQPLRDYVDFRDNFSAGENIIVTGASYGVADETLSGSAIIKASGELIVTTNKNIVEPNNFKSIFLHSALFTDATNGTLDFAAQYDVTSIVKSVNATDSSQFDYIITLDNADAINGNFALVTADLTSQVSATLTKNSAGMSLDGEYLIETVNELEITLVAPGDENDEWDKLELVDNQSTQGTYPNIGLSGSQENWIGWFKSDTPKATEFSANFVAQNGLYQGKYAKRVDVQVDIQQINDAGVPIGAITSYTDTLQGISNNRDSVGLTIRQQLGFTGAFQFRVRRTNDNGTGQDLVDEVKIRDFYAGRVGQTVYDGFTVIRTKMQATEKALGVKERRVNCIVTRLLHSWRGGTKSVYREATNVAANTIAHLALSANIGRLTTDYIDIASIYEVFDQMIDYFGNEEPAWFCYTFDDKNMSAKEKLAVVADAIFSTLYHQGGSRLYMQFERKVDMPKLLFNHRNKDPENPEVWTRSGGIENDYDGVEVEYISPIDDTKKTIRLPSETIQNPKKVTLTGVRSELQATIHAHRAWNKLQYQRVGVKFNAYAEADLITKRDPILLAKNINCRYVDGEVMRQDALVLTLSQAFEIPENETAYIHLQMTDATVDVIELVGNGDNSHQVILSRASVQALSTGQAMYNTPYIITCSNKTRQSMFLVAEKSTAGVQRSEITVVNYDDHYYDGDHLHLV